METGQPDPEYRPGGCNIGPAEVSRRRRAFWFLLAILVAAAFGLAGGGVPRPWRGLLVVPAAVFFLNWLQIRHRFCVFYGSLGRYNFGPAGRPQKVREPGDARADRRRVEQLMALGALAGAVLTLAFYCFP